MSRLGMGPAVLVVCAFACRTAPDPRPSPDAGSDAGSLNDAGPPVNIQLLAINDFHGHLDPPSPVPDGQGYLLALGGASYLATHVRNARAENANTLFVSAGDMFGNTPFLSQWFHDEPTVEVMGAMGLDADAVGNHEFDEGWPELMRMKDGGCHPVDGCRGRSPYPGAPMPFLAANVIDPTTRATIFPPYVIGHFGAAKVAIIGMVTRKTPDITYGAYRSGLQFNDEVASANALVPELQAMGIHAIVVVIHEGGVPSTLAFNGCENLTGRINAIASGLDPDIDVVLSGHTHYAYNCNIGGKLVTSALCFGRLFTRVQLTVDPLSGEVLSKSAVNVPVTRDVQQAADIEAILAEYRQWSMGATNQVVANIAADLTRTQNLAREATLGYAVADAMLEATASAGDGHADLALVNAGAMKADLQFARSGSESIDGQVTWAELVTALPWGNTLVTLTMTGAQIKLAYEDLFPTGTWYFPSSSFTFTWSASAAPGQHIDPTSMKLNGQVMEQAGSYRVTVPDVLANDAASYPAFQAGTNRFYGGTDQNVFLRYLVGHAPLAPPPFGRVTAVP